MDQDKEIARDIVVAVISHVSNAGVGAIPDIGDKAIELYKKVYKEVSSTT